MMAVRYITKQKKMKIFLLGVNKTFFRIWQ